MLLKLKYFLRSITLSNLELMLKFQGVQNQWNAPNYQVNVVKHPGCALAVEWMSVTWLDLL